MSQAHEVILAIGCIAGLFAVVFLIGSRYRDGLSKDEIREAEDDLRIW